MRVALDARTLQRRPIDGIGRVLANVVPRLDTDIDLTLLYDRRLGPAGNVQLAAGGRRESGASAVELGSGVPTGTAWLQGPAASWLRGFDGIFHCPFYALPYRQAVPMVVSLWDLTFETHPRWLPPHKRLAFRAQARHAARTARRIIVSSQVIREEVMERYRVDNDRIVIAPLAPDQAFHVRTAEEVAPVLARLGVRRPYAIAFGGAQRRRLDLAAAAWQWAGGTSRCGLVVIGTGAAVAGSLRTGAVDDETLGCLMSGATALLYPTEYEGFGLPAVEAQAAGTPVICAPVGALPEVLGGHAVWVEDHTAEAFGTALRQLLDDPAQQRRLSEDGLAWHRQRPGWDGAAAAFARAYRETDAG